MEFIKISTKGVINKLPKFVAIHAKNMISVSLQHSGSKNNAINPDSCFPFLDVVRSLTFNSLMFVLNFSDDIVSKLGDNST